MFKVALIILTHTLSGVNEKKCPTEMETLERIKNFPPQIVREPILVNKILKLDLDDKDLQREHKRQEAKRRKQQEKAEQEKKKQDRKRLKEQKEKTTTKKQQKSADANPTKPPPPPPTNANDSPGHVQITDL